MCDKDSGCSEGEVVGHGMCFVCPSDGRDKADDGQKQSRTTDGTVSPPGSQDLGDWSNVTGHGV